MKSDELRTRILAADLAWIPLALEAEHGVHHVLQWQGDQLTPFTSLAYALCGVLAWILLSENLHLDGFRGGWRLPSVISHLLLAVVLLAMLFLAIDNVSNTNVGPPTLLLFSAILLFGFLCIRGIALRRVLWRYQNGKVNRIVIVGSGQLATELAMKFKRHPEFMCKVVGFLCPAADLPVPPREAAAAAIAVSTMEVTALLDRERVNELVLAHVLASREILDLVALCRQRSIRVSLIPQPYDLYLSLPQLVDLGGLPLLQLADIASPAAAGIGKRLIDIVLGFLLAGFALPWILLAGAALRLSTGRAFRWENRIGQNGIQFPMLRLNVDRECKDKFGLAWFLSRFSISELPQFWNVLRGNMSLVGPRPEGPERAREYSSWQLQRLTVKPGMTGLAQVYGLRENHPSEDKTRLDLQYMLRASTLRDLSLLIETVWTLVVRGIDISRNALGGESASSPAAAPEPVALAAYLASFPEIMHHAHRTQSGSD